MQAYVGYRESEKGREASARVRVRGERGVEVDGWTDLRYFCPSKR